MKSFTNKLLTKYPILWNTKLLIVIPCMIMLTLVMIAITFFMIPTSFQTYHDHMTAYFMILSTILISFVGVILWSFNIGKHQTIRNCYPRSSLSIYKEWLIFFFILSMILSINLSVNIGTFLKFNSIYSAEQLQQDQEILQKVELLLPTYIQNYKNPFANTPTNPIQKGDTEILLLKDSTCLFLQSYDNGVKQLVEDSLAYLQPSLLYYENRFTYDRNSFLLEVKRQLINQDKIAIQQIMKGYLSLVNRLNISTGLTEDIWMAYIYNPPFYPIRKDNLFHSISNGAPMHLTMSNKNRLGSIEVGNNYTRYDEIKYYFNYVELLRYNNHKDLQDYILIILYIGLYLSLLVFCCRVFSNKTVLYAIVGTLLLIILFSAIAFMQIMERDYYRWTFIIILFFVLSIRLLLNAKKKNRNNILDVNFILWLLSLPLFLLSIADILKRLSTQDYFTLIILIVMISMYPISLLAKHICSLPDE